MPNPIDIFDMTVLTLPHIELANVTIGVGDAILAHPDYQEAGPPTVPDGHELKETGISYNALNTAVKAGDNSKKAEREALREKTVQQLVLALTWAAMRSVRENKPSLVANLGVELKKKGQSRSSIHPLVGAPKDPDVKHGPKSGTVLLNVTKVPGAVTYIVQACQGDPSREESWSHEWQFIKCKGNEVTGLEPGKTYYFRVRCLGHAGHGPWSSIVSLMAI